MRDICILLYIYVYSKPPMSCCWQHPLWFLVIYPISVGKETWFKGQHTVRRAWASASLNSRPARPTRARTARWCSLVLAVLVHWDHQNGIFLIKNLSKNIVPKRYEKHLKTMFFPFMGIPKEIGKCPLWGFPGCRRLDVFISMPGQRTRCAPGRLDGLHASKVML